MIRMFAGTPASPAHTHAGYPRHTHKFSCSRLAGSLREEGSEPLKPLLSKYKDVSEGGSAQSAGRLPLSWFCDVERQRVQLAAVLKMQT